MNDKLNAAIIAFVNSLLPFLVLTHIIHWDADTISSFMLVIPNFLTVLGLLYALNKAKAPGA